MRRIEDMKISEFNGIVLGFFFFSLGSDVSTFVFKSFCFSCRKVIHDSQISLIEVRF